MPKGLIPLMLSPNSTGGFGSRSSVLYANNNSKLNGLPVSPTSPAHRRHASDTPVIKLSRPPIRAMRRQSQQLPASLPSIPFTPAEWKRAITEIKGYNVTRRYRACSARCNEILTNIKNPMTVEPAYLIYLNFYAATSLEMCARPLACASSYRISLLRQARTHYERALSLIHAAEETATHRARSGSSASSLPSLHSPSGSISSRAWTPDSGIMTPASSLSRKSSLQQDPVAGEPRGRTKKKVSFELPKDKSRWSFTLPEPVIRPDSPTLGFDDEYFVSGAMRQELPEIPHNRFSRQEYETPASSPPSMPSISESEELSPTDSSFTDDNSVEEYALFRNANANANLGSARAIARYCETLSALKLQIINHLNALEHLLEKDLEQQQFDSPDSPISNDASSVITASFNRMSMGSRHRRGSSSVASLSFLDNDAGGDEEELRGRARRARIDKLRLNGWKRKRFDASRYEELCQVVMAELDQDHDQD